MKGKKGYKVLSCKCCDINAGLKDAYLQRLLKKELNDLKGRSPKDIMDSE